jgi:hypothetical protein
MFDVARDRVIGYHPSEKPRLLVLIDAEEEFDWRSFRRTGTSVKNIARQVLIQSILDRYQVTPMYLVDYPVADQRDGVAPLLEFLKDGRCTVGAQLHAWVNPPFDEEISVHNTYPGNLPRALEHAKIAALTAKIAEAFGVSPLVYRAGRYGIGVNTPTIIAGLGYRIDASVVPFTDYSASGGPNFLDAPADPHWIGEGRDILEIPCTVGLVGPLARFNRRLPRMVLAAGAQSVHVPGVFARFGLLERVRLTPEGISIDVAKRLTRTLVDQGHRVFVVSYHSSSLIPGSTPYVTSEADLTTFCDWFERYLEFFLADLGGRPASPAEILEDACARARRSV